MIVSLVVDPMQGITNNKMLLYIRPYFCEHYGRPVPERNLFIITPHMGAGA
ncbi:unnamed protein product, partial [Adineta steineri]